MLNVDVKVTEHSAGVLCAMIDVDGLKAVLFVGNNENRVDVHIHEFHEQDDDNLSCVPAHQMPWVLDGIEKYLAFSKSLTDAHHAKLGRLKIIVEIGLELEQRPDAIKTLAGLERTTKEIVNELEGLVKEGFVKHVGNNFMLYLATLKAAPEDVRESIMNNPINETELWSILKLYDPNGYELLIKEKGAA